MKKIIILSISSDIGMELAEQWMDKGHDVVGTFRTRNERLSALETQGVKTCYCDLLDLESMKEAAIYLQQNVPEWDAIILAPGLQEPVGPFLQSNFDEWAASVEANLTNQLRMLHSLLPFRNTSSELGPLALFFAGGGTNNATLNYSAYTMSKIGLIKMTELLDAEIPDTRFSILGPGWVKTKIHQATLQAAERAGDNYKRTVDMLAGDECVEMKRVVECCDWFLNAPREAVGGRNFSLVFDHWGSEELDKMLLKEPDMYKLRRYGNNFLQR